MEKVKINRFLRSLVALFLIVCIGEQISALQIDCDSPPPAIKESTCCRYPVFYDKQLFFDCVAELGHRNGSLAFECMAECTLKKSKVFLNNALKKEAAFVMIKKWLPPTDVQYQIVLDSTDYCFDLANSKQNQFSKVQRNRDADIEDNCNPISTFAMHCASRYILRKCPEAEWQGGELCESLKEYHNACPYPKIK